MSNRKGGGLEQLLMLESRASQNLKDQLALTAVQDLVYLPNFSEETLLETLHVRYNQSLIYVSDDDSVLLSFSFSSVFPIRLMRTINPSIRLFSSLD